MPLGRAWVVQVLPPSVVATTAPPVERDPVAQQSDVLAHAMPLRGPVPLGRACFVQVLPRWSWRRRNRREPGQQRHQRCRRHCPGASAADPFPQKGRPEAWPATAAIMGSMPQTPGEQARNAVTARIAAHIAAGWPRLGPPEVRFRGRHCYVAVTLSGHRQPTPSLRLGPSASTKPAPNSTAKTSSPGPPARPPAHPSRESTRPLALYAGPPARKQSRRPANRKLRKSSDLGHVLGVIDLDAA
jgi:hypothetical protein